ncbi:MAG: hypothetical protein Q9213_004343 [Squamulea squamosa]
MGGNTLSRMVLGQRTLDELDERRTVYVSRRTGQVIPRPMRLGGPRPFDPGQPHPMPLNPPRRMPPPGMHGPPGLRGAGMDGPPGMGGAGMGRGTASAGMGRGGGMPQGMMGGPPGMMGGPPGMMNTGGRGRGSRAGSASTGRSSIKKVPSDNHPENN